MYKMMSSFLLLTAEFLWMNVEIIQKLFLYIFEKAKFKLMYVWEGWQDSNSGEST